VGPVQLSCQRNTSATSSALSRTGPACTDRPGRPRGNSDGLSAPAG
jgi:hypothetical protein